jgi:hypothetical protein
MKLDGSRDQARANEHASEGGCGGVQLWTGRTMTEQCLNYRNATGLHLCLLLNFGKPRLEIKRIVLDL